MNAVSSSLADCVPTGLPAAGVEGASLPATAGATPELASSLTLPQPFIELLANAAIATAVPAESTALPALPLPPELSQSAPHPEKSTAQDDDHLTVEDVLQLARDESAVALLFYPLTAAIPAPLPTATATAAVAGSNELAAAPATDALPDVAAATTPRRRTLAAPQISLPAGSGKAAGPELQTAAAAATRRDTDSATADNGLSLGTLLQIGADADSDGDTLDLVRGRDATNSSAVIKAAATDVNALAAAAPAASRASTDSQVVVRTVAVPVHHPQWTGAVAAEVRWCVANSVQSATLRLVPENLGPVEIRVDVQDSQVNVNFSAAHADTRTALEASMPKLRDMLAGAGLSLGQASVQQETGRGSQNSPNAPQAALPEEERAAAPRGLAMLGLVDEYV
jgi:flagellar hook-length control protein FliK